MFYLIENNHVNPGDGVVKASYLELDAVPINGFRVVEVPDDVSIDESYGMGRLTYSDVLAQKYEGLLEQRPPFDGVHYFDLTDRSEINEANEITSNNYLIGDGIYRINGDGGSIETIGIGFDGMFDEFLVYWDAFELVRDGSSATKYYTEVDSDDLSVSILPDDPSDTQSVEFMRRTQLPKETENITIQIENNTATSIYLGGLAILFSKSQE